MSIRHIWMVCSVIRCRDSIRGIWGDPEQVDWVHLPSGEVGLGVKTVALSILYCSKAIAEVNE